ncbi:hypothetical protein JCM11641_007463 [Rhodosporidiobolus odoratus]
MPDYAPFIIAPPLTCCDHAYLVYGQGKAPYTLSIIASGDANGTLLEQLPLQHKPGVARWRVDFNEGANITFVVSDGNNQQAYSQYRVVQAGDVATCSKTNYSHQSTSVGPIVGGVVGGVVVVALCVAFLWWRRRQMHKRRGILDSNDGSKHASTDDMRLTDGPASLDRAGTFNLGNVRFTEASLDQLRAIDRPPNYDETSGEILPPPVVSGRSRGNRVTAQQERLDRELAERLEREEAAATRHRDDVQAS